MDTGDNTKDPWQSEIDELRKILNQHDNTLYGEKGSLEEPWGVVHKVSVNTNFRNNADKLLWVIIFLVSSLIIDRLFDIFS